MPKSKRQCIFARASTEVYEQDLNPAVVGALSTRGKIIGLVVQLVIPSTRDCLSPEKVLKMFIVYILQSHVDDSFYIGQTQDVKARLISHNKGESRYTSRKKPWKLVYTEEYNARKEALQRERFLKQQRNREFYQSLIKNWSGSSVG